MLRDFKMSHGVFLILALMLFVGQAAAETATAETDIETPETNLATAPDSTPSACTVAPGTVAPGTVAPGIASNDESVFDASILQRDDVVFEISQEEGVWRLRYRYLSDEDSDEEWLPALDCVCPLGCFGECTITDAGGCVGPCDRHGSPCSPCAWR